jgi:CRP-like cAMP-binding protein
MLLPQVLGWIGEPGVELRVRTVRAVTDVELAYLTRDDVHSLKNQYSELKARLLRFERCGTIVDRKTLRRIDLTEQELQDISTTFKNRLRESTNARNRHNLEEHAYVPPIFLSQTARDVMAASTRFKKVGERQRAQQQLEREKEEVRV